MGREEELKELEELDIFFFPDDKLNFSLSSAHTSTSSASVLSSPDASLPSMTTLNQMNYVPLPDPDEMDDDLFFDLSQNPKVRSSSFGGVTQYSQQFLNVRSQFKPSLCPISSHPSSLYDSSEHIGRLGGSSTNSNGVLHSPDANSTYSEVSSPVMNGVSPTESNEVSSNSKKSTTRRNAWGNMSYADLITQAILQSPDKRLTLSQVYEWMVQNVPYFRDKGDSNSSAGWKNSIRHNLSLHSRFMRIQNEGAGKSSWWVINPDAKPGRNPRRRERATTIDVTNKAALDKSRGRARKKIKDLRCGQIIGSVNCMAGSQASIVSHDLYDEESMQGNFEPVFRPRTQSNLSVPGSSARVSPSMEQPFDDLDFPPWVDTASNMAIPNDIVDRTDQMRIDAARCGIGNNGNMNAYAQQQHQMQQIKQEPKIIKQENGAPPSYHELNSVRGPCAQNPLLRTQMTPPGKYQPMNMYQAYGNWGAAGVPVSAHACGVQQQSQSLGSALPIDLENLTLPDQPLMDVDMDVESLLRHELSQTRDHQLNFDL